MRITSTRLILLSALVLSLFFNLAFFRNVLVSFPLNPGNLWFLTSLFLFLTAMVVFVLSLIGNRWLLKPVLCLLFPLSAVASYFMNSYNIVLDTAMLENILATDSHESFDLLSPSLFVWLFLGGLLPALFIARIQLVPDTFGRTLVRQGLGMSGAVVVMMFCLFTSSSHYASFIREHKHLRYYTNPVTFIYSGVRLALDNLEHPPNGEKVVVGADAQIPDDDKDRELIIMVVGETARADHFSLNGYARETNPLLAKEEVISFKHMNSCATSTAISVPCMFALANGDEFESKDSGYIENLLDVLTHADTNIIWRDNNSDSKGVASELYYEDYRSPDRNAVCDEECRDVGMIDGLDAYIDSVPEGDILIVLHQMGNHGPAYFKRYPADFEAFTPVCRSNQLENCTKEEIHNAYDNAILYTDYFLSEVIAFLKQYDNSFETAMFYVSDHGESLGEHSLYLHGLPLFMAPEEQTHVASVVWLGSGFNSEFPIAQANAEKAISHDMVFHTMLGFMEIETDVYIPYLDLVRTKL